MSGRRLIVLEAVDTVATAAAPLQPGEVVIAPDWTELRVVDHVPRGHKVSLRDHAAGDPVLKFGARIGVATQPIARGEHVHTHNLRTVRGRRADG